jgi:glycosyltransferase involved in cell wall biosynthesis
MQKFAYIISLKCAPGLKKEFELLGENIRSKGFHIKYLLSAGYKTLGEKKSGTEYITANNDLSGMLADTGKLLMFRRFYQIFSGTNPGFLFFYNPHLINPFVARMVKKKFPDAIIALYLHDPYKPDKAPYGVLKGILISLVEFIQGLTVRYMDYVISPSEYSSFLFKKKYPSYKGTNFIAPLLVPDQKNIQPAGRKYFSIVGHAQQATGHDTFINLVNYAGEKGLDFDFVLISSSDISLLTKSLSEKGKQRLTIINKNSITDSEINEVIRQSWAVFRLDWEVTQSGVLPVAYMNETPIIARDIPGLRQHVNHKGNGYIVPFDCSNDTLIEAMTFIKNNISILTFNARKSYDEIWAESNFDKYYDWLIDLLNA